MTLVTEFTRDLRGIGSEIAERYFGRILETNSLRAVLIPELRSNKGRFFVSASETANLSDPAVLDFGLGDPGHALSTQYSSISNALTDSGLGSLCVLDPYFAKSELGAICPQTAIAETSAGAWQLSDPRQLQCCIEACNYFFPLIFALAERPVETPNEIEFHKGIVEAAQVIVIEAFDNDGLLLWEKLG